MELGKLVRRLLTDYWIVIAVVTLIVGCIIFGVIEFPPH